MKYVNGARRLAVLPAEVDAVNLQSDEVRTMLGTVPHWAIRSGQGYLLLVLAIAFATGWFIRYPDKIVAPVVLTARSAPARVVARSSGHVVLWTADKQSVSAGQYLGYLRNPASVEDILELRRAVEGLQRNLAAHGEARFDLARFESASLGEVQEAYIEFETRVRRHRLWIGQRRFPRQRDALNRQISELRLLVSQTEATHAAWSEELEMSATRLRMDSTLHAQGLASRAEYLDRQRVHLAARRDYRSSVAGIANLHVTIAQLNDQIRQSSEEEERENADLTSALDAGAKALRGAIRSWEQAHMLTAPIDGRVGLFAFWSDQQYVEAGQEVLAVVPRNPTGTVGMIDAPVERSGLIKVGQVVHVQLSGYPAEQFGRLRGRVQSISLLPRENLYRIAVVLPRGLRTDHGKELEFRQEMTGSATIITENRRLVERLISMGRRAVG